jgi:hypothetical protein
MYETRACCLVMRDPVIWVAYCSTISFKTLITPLLQPDGDMWTPSAQKDCVGSILGISIGVVSDPDVM